MRTKNASHQLNHELVGMRVYSAHGKLEGVVREVGPDFLHLYKKLLPFGPRMGEKFIPRHRIDHVGIKSVRLKPSECEYWQMPQDDFMEPYPKIVVL